MQSPEVVAAAPARRGRIPSNLIATEYPLPVGATNKNTPGRTGQPGARELNRGSLPFKLLGTAGEGTWRPCPLGPTSSR